VLAALGPLAAVGLHEHAQVLGEGAEEDPRWGAVSPGRGGKRHRWLTGEQVEAIACWRRQGHQADERVDDGQAKPAHALPPRAGIALRLAQELVGGLDVLAHEAHGHAGVVGATPATPRGGAKDPGDSRAVVDGIDGLGQLVSQDAAHEVQVEGGHRRGKRLPGPTPAAAHHLAERPVLCKPQHQVIGLLQPVEDAAVAATLGEAAPGTHCAREPEANGQAAVRQLAHPQSAEAIALVEHNASLLEPYLLEGGVAVGRGVEHGQ